MDGRHLIYFADPMCSWCYGFLPVIKQIREQFADRLPIRLVMGGLRPGAEEVFSEKARASLRSHWPQITQASGQPFDYAVLDRDDFVYDTDPAARAVVIVRRTSQDLALYFLGVVQTAFYGRNQDITSAEVLADLAAGLGLSRAGFLELFESRDARQETWRDYAVSQRAGVTGFPTLVGGPNEEGAYGVITRGFAPADQVLDVLKRWVDASD